MFFRRTAGLVKDLGRLLGRGNVLSQPAELAVYECDGFTIEKHLPDAVVFPRSTEEVAEVVRICARHNVPIVARGAGTSLAGGCLPVGGGVVVMLTRMRKIIEINLRDRVATVEAGVTNIELGRALVGSGFHFAPDPSSQVACTLGGNVATNAGGPHTLKYGVTGNHVVGLEVVTADGEIVRLSPQPGSLDLIGLMVGSEGTLGIVCRMWLRLTPNPQGFRTLRAMFANVEDATNAVSDIIAAGIIPAAMELMDRGIISAVEEAFHFGFSLDVGAIAVIEVDGPEVGLADHLRRIVEICRSRNAQEVLEAETAQQRELLWKCRKLSVGAVGRLSPSYCIQDGVVPRTKLPHILRRIAEISAKYGIRIVNVAHAGDGNVHPILLFDERDREGVERALAAGRELLEECIDCQGSITAEHGIGVEKLALMNRLFSPSDLAVMRRVRAGLDPEGRLNPGKLIPMADAECETAAVAGACS